MREGIGLETPDDLLQLIDAAAEALAILLENSGPCEATSSAEKAAADGTNANNAGHAVSSNFQRRHDVRLGNVGQTFADLASTGLHARRHHEDHGFEARASGIRAHDLIDREDGVVACMKASRAQSLTRRTASASIFGAPSASLRKAPKRAKPYLMWEA